MVEVIEKQTRAASVLFVVNEDPSKQVPMELVKAHRLQEPLCKVLWGQRRDYLILTFNSQEDSKRYIAVLSGSCLSGKVAKDHKHANVRLVADCIPVPVAHNTRKNERERERGERGGINRDKGGYGCYCCSVTEFLQCVEKVLGVDKRLVLDEEFATYVDLKMSLHVGPEEFLPHFQRILQGVELSAAAYLGQDNITLNEAEGLVHDSLAGEVSD